MKLLHEKGVRIVILSSTDFSSHGQLVCLASQKNSEGYEQARIEFPGKEQEFDFKTSDKFSRNRDPNKPEQAIEIHSNQKRKTNNRK